MKKIIVIIIVVMLVLVGGYFVWQRSYQTSTQVATPTPTTPEQITTSTVSTAREFIILGTEYGFNPSSIKVKSGEQVKITFKNSGRAPHNLVIEGLGIGTKTIGESGTDTVEFTAPASGTYPIFCSIPGHRADGMKGQLIVE